MLPRLGDPIACSLAARALGCFCVNNRDIQHLALQVHLSSACRRLLPLIVNALSLQLGAMPRLNRMLASPMLHVKQHSALSLSFLCSTNSSAQLAAADAGALSAVQDLLHSNRAQVVVTGLRFIFNLACVAIVNRCTITSIVPSYQPLQVRQHQDAGAVDAAGCNCRHNINFKERECAKRRGCRDAVAQCSRLRQRWR